MNAPKMLLVASVLLASHAVFAEDTNAPVATIYDMKYGSEERQVLDFWKADSERPSPVLVLIHGGGWIHGDKADEARNQRQLIRKMLGNGVSVAAINYRYVPQDVLPAPVYDAARAIQFLKYKAVELNLDKTHIAVTGGSAGGCSALWLATHDDLANPEAMDPVLRESSSVCGALAGDAQTTIDPKQIREWDNEDALKHCMITWSMGFKSVQEMDEKYDSAQALFYEFSPINHLDANDPPMMLTYSGPLDASGDGIHGAKFGLHFKKKADFVGAHCILALRKHPEQYPEVPKQWDFLLEILGLKSAD